jgi:hypothetical protein
MYLTSSPSNRQATRTDSALIRRYVYNAEINLYLIIYGTVIGVIILLFLNAFISKFHSQIVGLSINLV